MFRIKRPGVLLAAAVITAFVSLSWQGPLDVSAHGVVDQQNLLNSGLGAAILDDIEPAGQEFTPTANTIVGADISLESLNPSGDASMTLNVRAGSISGAILGSVTQSVPEDLPGGYGFVHFDLLSPVYLTPGLTYVLELSTSNDSHQLHYETAGDYTGGRAVILSSPVEQQDVVFRTYGKVAQINGDVDCSGSVNSVDSLKILRHNAGLSVSQTEPCVDIGQPLP